MMADSHIVLGLWPIAGITTIGVTKQDASATIGSAIDAGITCFDTAYSYGYAGESDRLLGAALGGDRDRFQVIGKVGQRWDDHNRRVIDGSPEALTRDAETSLRRIGIERFDLLMLHSPDPQVPIKTSAEAIAMLQRRGLCRQIGVCNVDAAKLHEFSEAVRCDAIQCPLNLLQRQSLHALIPQAAAIQCDVYVYWSLMKGLLAGHISRAHRFAPGDSRPGYEIFQGQARAQTHDILDSLQPIAKQAGITIAQLAIGWALAQNGVTAALVGARHPQQIQETAQAKPLHSEITRQIDAIVQSFT